MVWSVPYRTYHTVWAGTMGDKGGKTFFCHARKKRRVEWLDDISISCMGTMREKYIRLEKLESFV